MIKKGDNVRIMTGKDRGTAGKVLAVIPKHDRVVVEGLNKRKRHIRPRRSGEKGQIVEVESSMHISNVQLVCPHCKKAVRVGQRIIDGKKVRVCRSCNREGI